MGHRILVVDDENTLVQSLRAYLEQAGFDVETASDGRQALLAFEQMRPDLIVLDIMLPEIDGLTVLQQLRRKSDVYVIMLTAKADEADKVIGLGLGADDYVTKPFSPRELVARIQAALRRLSGQSGQPTVLVSRHLRLDVAAHLAWKDGQPIDLTPLEFELLHCFMQYRGRALSRDQLIEKVWGYDYYGEERVVDIHIGRLRKKIEADAAQPTLLVTVWGAGYRFEDEAA